MALRIYIIQKINILYNPKYCVYIEFNPIHKKVKCTAQLILLNLGDGKYESLSKDVLVESPGIFHGVDEFRSRRLLSIFLGHVLVNGFNDGVRHGLGHGNLAAHVYQSAAALVSSVHTHNFRKIKSNGSEIF